MWNNSKNVVNHLRNLSSPFLATSSGFLSQQTRNTFILKRKWPPGLSKKNARPRPLMAKHYVYELVEDTNVRRKPDLEVILTTYVEGLGNKGDRVSMRPNAAYTQLLLPGLAVYPTPENCERFKKDEYADKKEQFSSPYVERTISVLSQRVIAITLSDHNPWVLEKWHVKACLRKSGMHVPEEAISLPDKEIAGPNPEIEGKEFFVKVTINNKEEVKVRCRIHHIHQDRQSATLGVDWYKEPAEPIFLEDKPILDEMPRYFEPKTTTA